MVGLQGRGYRFFFFCSTCVCAPRLGENIVHLLAKIRRFDTNVPSAKLLKIVLRPRCKLTDLANWPGRGSFRGICKDCRSRGVEQTKHLLKWFLKPLTDFCAYYIIDTSMLTSESRFNLRLIRALSMKNVISDAKPCDAARAPATKQIGPCSGISP